MTIGLDGLKKHAPYLLLALFALVGYGAYSAGMALLDDDVAGRMRGINNTTAIEAQLQNFRVWTMGRPFGHASNATFHTIFRDLPESVILFVAFTAVTLQAMLMFRISQKTGLSNSVAFFASLVFLITPIAASLNLVVHALATELSTWFMLAAILLALDKRHIVAGAVCALQINTYEIYLPIFFLPMIFFGLKSLIDCSFSLKSYAIDCVKYGVAFVVTAGAFFGFRIFMDTNGREAAIEGMSVIDVIGRMFSAGAIGSGTNFGLHLDSFLWAMRNGPSYILAFFVLATLAGFYLLRNSTSLIPGDAAPAKTYPAYLPWVVFLAGLVLVYLSYFIFFSQRYPPNYEVSRLANIHAGSRFGLYFMAAGVVMLWSWGYGMFKQRFGSAQGEAFGLAGSWLGAITLSAFVSFNHAYGYQQTVAADRKMEMVHALRYACERTRSEDIIVLIASREAQTLRTDRVLSWTMPWFGVTSFESWDTNYLVVRHHNGDQFLELLAGTEAVTVDELAPVVDPAFVNYGWLHPWGALRRWELDDRAFFIMDMRNDGYGHSGMVVGQAGPLDATRECAYR